MGKRILKEVEKNGGKQEKIEMLQMGDWALSRHQRVIIIWFGKVRRKISSEIEKLIFKNVCASRCI
jgi:hypothetical protein